MLGEKIVFASAGTLCVAAIAIFFAIFQYWFFVKKPDYTWNGWGAALSFGTFIFAVAKFLQYNTPAGDLNHSLEQVQYSVFLFMIHCTFGYTFAYLIINGRHYHLLAGIFHLFMIILIWTTDLVVGPVFAYHEFIGLQQPYIEPIPGKTGIFLHVYFGIAMIGILCTWLFQFQKSRQRRHFHFFRVWCLDSLCFQ